MLQLLLLIGGIIALSTLWLMRAVVMPGPAHGRMYAVDVSVGLAGLEAELRRHVIQLAETIGPRHYWRAGSLEGTAKYIGDEFAHYGYTVGVQDFKMAHEPGEFRNLEVEIEGTRVADEILIIGAHYDTVPSSPGADDNATGIAALLALASLLRNERFGRSVRFVAFANEEEPFAGTDGMGSEIYARRTLARGEAVLGMLALESLGYYSEKPRSQHYPPALAWCYPDRGNFVAFVGNVKSRYFLRTAVGSFRRSAGIPSEGLSLPERLAPDISRSDHAAFWRAGYPAIMVTDTVPFRNPHYHTENDLPGTLDFKRFTLTVHGLLAMVRELAA